MLPRPSVQAAIAELAKRRPAPVESRRLADEAAASRAASLLRSIFLEHPKQAAFFRRDAEHPLRATTKTRRAGATAGGVREFLARAIEQPGFRATYTTTTRTEAHDRAWANDTQSGFADVLRQLGEQLHRDIETVKLGGVEVEIRIGDLALEFSNGSRIDLYGADNLRALRKKRGGAKHVFWVDEAQDFPFLDVFYKAVVVAALTDKDGECWITGTPGQDCVGMFFDLTGADVPSPGWEIHVLAAVDNPFFGRIVQADDAYYVDDNLGVRRGPYEDRGAADEAAKAIRWENAAAKAIRRNEFKDDDPDVQRELYGRWVKADSRNVYPVHAVPEHVLLFAPPRLRDNPFVGTHPRFDKHPPWYDHEAALQDLPRDRRRRGKPYQWLFSIGADFGFRPDPFALTVTAFCPELTDVYEMFSWKCTEVETDDQAAYMKLLWDAIPQIVSFVGDAAGQKANFAQWSRRMNLPIDEADKQGKNVLEEFLANDIRRGRYHLRRDSELHTEMRHLVYLPGKPGKTREVHKHRKVNGIVHGDHCCDCSRYGYTDLTHYLSKLRTDKPEPGSTAALQAEGEREDDRIFERETRRAAARAYGDDDAPMSGDWTTEW